MKISARSTCMLMVLLVVSASFVAEPSVSAEPKQKQQMKYMMKIGEDTVSTEVGSAFAQAQELIKTGDYAQAEALLKPLVQQVPNIAPVHYKYGFVLMQRSKFEETIEQAKICIQLAPNFVGGYQLLGEASEELKQTAQALDAYKKALALQPRGENADIIKEHISDLLNPQQEEEPEPVVVDTNKDKNRAAMKVNQAFSLCDSAKQHFAQKKFEDGMQDCRDALAIAPESDVVRETFLGSLNNYAADCVNRQDMKQAEVLMKEAVAFQSQGGVPTKTRLTTLKNYMGLLNFLGRADEAKKIEIQMKAVASSTQ